MLPFDSPGKPKIEWADYIYKNREKAKMDIFKCIEIFYNPMRRHSSSGNISPMGYERRYNYWTRMGASPFAGKHNHKDKCDLL